MTDGLHQVGKQRLTELVEIAARHRIDFNSDPPLSAADIDEIRYLTRLLGRELPTSFVEIANSGVKYEQEAQQAFGERLQRSLQLHERFGALAEATEPAKDGDELDPRFTLEADEQTRVIKLSSDIRKIVLASTLFDEPHKRRLLNRIAAVENEVLKSKGRLDTVLAGISDVGDTLKKFGGDLKPLTERYNEIVRITRGKSDQYQQIPPPDELDALPAPSAESDEE